MSQAKVSSKYQIVIPKEAREKVGINQGDKVEVISTEHGIYLSPQPKSWTDYGKGLGKEVWKEIDPLNYIKEERRSWEKAEDRDKA